MQAFIQKFNQNWGKWSAAYRISKTSEGINHRREMYDLDILIRWKDIQKLQKKGEGSFSIKLLIKPCNRFCSLYYMLGLPVCIYRNVVRCINLCTPLYLLLSKNMYATFLTDGLIVKQKTHIGTPWNYSSNCELAGNALIYLLQFYISFFLVFHIILDD